MNENIEKFNPHKSLSALLDKHEGKIDRDTMLTYLSFIAFSSMMNSFPAVRPTAILPNTPVTTTPNEPVNLSNVLEKIQNDPASMTKINNLFSGKGNSGLDTNKLNSMLSNIGKGSSGINASQLAPLISLLGNQKTDGLSGLLSAFGGGSKGLNGNLLESLAPLAGLLGKNAGGISNLSKFAPLLPLLDGLGSKKGKGGKKGKRNRRDTPSLPLESLLALGGGNGSGLGSMLPLLLLLGSGKSGLFKGFQGMLKPFVKK